MKNTANAQPWECLSLNPVQTLHFQRLVDTLDGYYQAGHFSGPAKTIREATACVTEAVRSAAVDKEPGMDLIYDLSEMQVFICQILEHYQAIKDFAPELIRP